MEFFKGSMVGFVVGVLFGGLGVGYIFWSYYDELRQKYRNALELAKNTYQEAKKI